MRCPTCNIEMEEGCIIAAKYIVVWYKGKIGERKIGGPLVNVARKMAAAVNTLLPKREMSNIEAFRCPTCGRLEFYARNIEVR